MRAVLKTPYLVQRVMVRPSGEINNGVDRYFSYAYMGSAEFEFGALFHALNRMRAWEEKVEVHPIKVPTNLTPDGFTVVNPGLPVSETFYYVGPDTLIDTCRVFIMDQLGPETIHLKEASYLKKDEAQRSRIVGWWCIDVGLEFVFFRDEHHAVNFLKGLAQP